MSVKYFDDMRKAKRELIEYANSLGWAWDEDAIDILASLACEYSLQDVVRAAWCNFTIEHCYKTRGWDRRAYREYMEEMLEEYEEERMEALAQCL